MNERFPALVLAGLLAGCAGSGAGEEPRLRSAAGEFGPVMFGIPRVAQGQSWVIRGLTLCVDGPAPVEVVEVRGVESDLGVEAFAFQGLGPDEPALETDRRGTLADSGFDPAATSVEAGCDSGASDELAIQVVNPHSGVGLARAFEVVYESGDRERVLRIPYELRLCPLRSAAAPACDPK